MMEYGSLMLWRKLPDIVLLYIVPWEKPHCKVKKPQILSMGRWLKEKTVCEDVNN